ncbi:hypothetical protein [Bradyrhizobium sp. CW1]|jgi:hypothetical protein|uniref:hypothetical protein n=1 Tax=Bradyrhizobium sp. CW1 TaxID=2782686 RepID=UPI001FFF1913|nr:hypothetical protein [Bradyrhizobium sp. CW1]UPJ28882.1 hypothetical protein IVB54_07500 [Bradyrhizobium sp. CW1]
MKRKGLKPVEVGEFVREWVAPGGDVTGQTTDTELQVICDAYLNQAREEGCAVDGSLMDGLAELRDWVRSR